MTLLEGSIAVDGSFAYVAQQAWILNATLRDNILFGKEFDEDRSVVCVHVLTLCKCSTFWCKLKKLIRTGASLRPRSTLVSIPQFSSCQPV